MTSSDRKRKPAAWELYDPSAAAYHRYAAPGSFTDVARDLVAMLNLSPGDRVLDVGSGTGVVAAQACNRVMPGGRVVGVDLSAPMLSHRPPRVAAVVGEVPGLPCADGAFDAVCASFVLSHVEDYVAAIRDMMRVTRAAGRVGVTAWDNSTNAYDTLWGRVAARFVDTVALGRATRENRPYQEWLGNPDNLRDALVTVGLESVTVQTRGYVTDVTLDDYLETKALLLSGRYIRHHVSDDEWLRFRSELEREFQTTHGDRVRFNHPAHVAVGRKGY